MICKVVFHFTGKCVYCAPLCPTVWIHAIHSTFNVVLAFNYCNKYLRWSALKKESLSWLKVPVHGWLAQLLWAHGNTVHHGKQACLPCGQEVNERGIDLGPTISFKGAPQWSKAFWCALPLKHSTISQPWDGIQPFSNGSLEDISYLNHSNDHVHFSQ